MHEGRREYTDLRGPYLWCPSSTIGNYGGQLPNIYVYNTPKISEFIDFLLIH